MTRSTRMAAGALCLWLACGAACGPAPAHPEAAAPKPAAGSEPSRAAVQATDAPEQQQAASRASADAFTPPDADGWGSAAGLRYLEVVKGGAQADQALPLAVMIHGLGDRPRDVWIDRSGEPLRVVMPQAPLPHGGGYSWFPYRVGDRDEAALAGGIQAAAAQLARALALLARQRPTLGRPIVSGFSQGGMLSYALALGHPDVVEAAFPLSGLLPRPLWPNAPAGDRRLPPIRAAHGDADRVVPIAPAQALIRHLRDLGYDADLRVYPGVQHRVTGEMAAQMGIQVDHAARMIAQRM